MGEWIDFTDLKARISLEDVIVGYYGITTLTRTGSKLVGPCPVHGGDSPRAFSADLKKNVFFCFSKCKGGGNQLDFVARKEGISIREAALRLKAHFFGPAEHQPAARPARSSQKATRTGNGTANPVHTSERPAHAAPVIQDRNPPLNVTLQLDGSHPHLLRERGLKPETIACFGLGYCARGLLRGTVAIPVHDEEGTLVAYAGRRLKPQAIREEGKYKLPKGFKKQLVLYNFHRAVPYAAERGLILVEGFFSVLKLHEIGLTNVVAAMGTDLSDAQADLLGQAREVIILFDGDDAGMRGAEAAREKLKGHTLVRVVTLPSGVEPESLSTDELRWLFEGLHKLGMTAIAFSQEADTLPLVEDEPATTESSNAIEVGPPQGSARCANE